MILHFVLLIQPVDELRKSLYDYAAVKKVELDTQKVSQLELQQKYSVTLRAQA